MNAAQPSKPSTNPAFEKPQTGVMSPQPILTAGRIQSISKTVWKYTTLTLSLEEITSDLARELPQMQPSLWSSFCEHRYRMDMTRRHNTLVPVSDSPMQTSSYQSLHPLSKMHQPSAQRSFTHSGPNGKQYPSYHVHPESISSDRTPQVLNSLSTSRNRSTTGVVHLADKGIRHARLAGASRVPNGSIIKGKVHFSDGKGAGRPATTIAPSNHNSGMFTINPNRDYRQGQSAPYAGPYSQQSRRSASSISHAGNQSQGLPRQYPGIASQPYNAVQRVHLVGDKMHQSTLPPSRPNHAMMEHKSADIQRKHNSIVARAVLLAAGRIPNEALNVRLLKYKSLFDKQIDVRRIHENDPPVPGVTAKHNPKVPHKAISKALREYGRSRSSEQDLIGEAAGSPRSTSVQLDAPLDVCTAIADVAIAQTLVPSGMSTMQTVERDKLPQHAHVNAEGQTKKLKSSQVQRIAPMPSTSQSSRTGHLEFVKTTVPSVAAFAHNSKPSSKAGLEYRQGRQTSSSTGIPNEKERLPQIDQESSRILNARALKTMEPRKRVAVVAETPSSVTHSKQSTLPEMTANSTTSSRKIASMEHGSSKAGVIPQVVIPTLKRKRSFNTYYDPEEAAKVNAIDEYRSQRLATLEATTHIEPKRDRSSGKDTGVLGFPVYRCGFWNCTAKLHDYDTLVRHCDRVHGHRDESGVFGCHWGDCHDRKIFFTDLDRWEAHLDEEHQQSIQHVCRLRDCKMAFPYEDDLALHMMSHKTRRSESEESVGVSQDAGVSRMMANRDLDAGDDLDVLGTGTATTGDGFLDYDQQPIPFRVGWDECHDVMEHVHLGIRNSPRIWIESDPRSRRTLVDPLLGLKNGEETRRSIEPIVLDDHGA